MTKKRIRPRKKNPELKDWVEHLEDLRLVLLKSLGAWFLASGVLFVFSDRLLALIYLPLKWAFPGSGAPPSLLALTPAGPFLVSLRLALGAGLVFSAPFIIAWFLLFLTPALKEKERNLLTPFLIAGVLLFLVGLFFAFRGVLPLAIRFFAGYAVRLGVSPFWGLSDYVSLVFRLLMAFGLAFEFPLVILGLCALGIIDNSGLKSARPFVVVGVLIVAALLTPPDILTQLFLALPLLILFEICVFLSKFINSRHNRYVEERKGADQGPEN